MPACREEWAKAYAQQSASDFLVYEELSAHSAALNIDQCHRLHYLQMALEKIAKAYEFRDRETSEDKLRGSHVAFSKFIGAYLASPRVKEEYRGRDAQLTRFTQSARNLAREIEKLAPAVDRKQSPQNAEYPWEWDDKVEVPCHYKYPNLSSLQEPAGLNLLKLMKEAIVDFDKLRLR